MFLGSDFLEQHSLLGQGLLEHNCDSLQKAPDWVLFFALS